VGECTLEYFEKRIDGEVKYEGIIVDVLLDRAELHNGAIVRREVVKHPGGVTILPAKGYYSGADTSMVYLVLNRFQIGKMKEVVRRYDSKAYIAISEVADVYSSKP